MGRLPTLDLGFTCVSGIFDVDRSFMIVIRGVWLVLSVVTDK